MSVRDPRPDDSLLRRLRLSRGWSLRRLGEVTEINRNRLWMLEGGMQSRRAERVKLAAVLGIEPDALLNCEATHEGR